MSLPLAALGRHSGLPATRRPVRLWSIVALLCIAFVVAYFDRVNLSVSLAIPEFKQHFGLGDNDRGALNSAFFWSYAALQIPAGWIVDRFGVKRTLASGFALWSLISAATGFAGSFAQLFVLRLLLGVGEAVNVPAGMRWIRHHCSEERRGLAIGLYMGSSNAAPAIGVPLATWLAATYGWRWVFILLGAGCLVWLVPWLLFVEDDDRRPATAVASDVPAVASPAAPMSVGTILRSPAFVGILIGTFCYQYFLYFCMTWMPAYLVERRGLSLTDMGFYSMVAFAGNASMVAIGGWSADRLIRRGGDPIGVRRGFAIAGLLLASTEVIGALSPSPGVALFFTVFSLTGLGLTTANYWALTQTLIPGTAVGRIVGIQNCAANIPGVVAPLLTGWLKQTTGSYDAPLFAIFVFLLMGVAAYVVLVRPRYLPNGGKRSIGD